MGRAKNLPVGGKDVGVCRQGCESLPALEGEILPAVGRRKERRAQDDTRGGYYVCLLAFPPAGGDPSACGRQDDTRGASRMTLKDLNQARQQDPPRRMSFITPPNNKQRSAHPTLSFRAGHPTANKDQPTKRCHSEQAPYGWAVRRISLWAERVQGYATCVCWHSHPQGNPPLAESNYNCINAHDTV